MVKIESGCGLTVNRNERYLNLVIWNVATTVKYLLVGPGHGSRHKVLTMQSILCFPCDDKKR